MCQPAKLLRSTSTCSRSKQVNETSKVSFAEFIDTRQAADDLSPRIRYVSLFLRMYVVYLRSVFSRKARTASTEENGTPFACACQKFSWRRCRFSLFVLSFFLFFLGFEVTYIARAPRHAAPRHAGSIDTILTSAKETHSSNLSQTKQTDMRRGLDPETWRGPNPRSSGANESHKILLANPETSPPD